MGLTKRIWIERDPAYEDVRRQFLEGAKLDEFTFRIPTRRKNPASSFRRWCPLWPASLEMAAKRLNFEHRWINDGIFFRSQAEQEAVRALADTLWRERLRTAGW